jgi:hypothetical protein
VLLVITIVHLGGDGIAVSGENKIDQRLPPRQVSVVDAARALDYAEQQGQRSLYATLGERFPGSILVVDPEHPALSTEEAQALGRVVRILEAPGFEVDRPDGAPSIEGLFRSATWRPWQIHVLDAAADVLIVRDRRGTTLLVDLRLVSETQRTELAQIIGDGEPDAARAHSSTRPQPVAAAVRESVLLVALMLVGGLVLPRGVGAGRARPPLALLVGVGLQGAVGSFVPGYAALVVPLVVAALIATWLSRRRGPVGWIRSDAVSLAVMSAAILAVSLAVRLQGLVVVSTDGGSYLVRAAAAAAGERITLGVQGASFSALHASGMLVGADGLFALGPVLLLAATLLLARAALGVLREVARGSRHERALQGLPGAGAAPVLLALLLGLLVLLPAASPGIRFSSMLVHAHVLVAAQAVALLVLWSERDPSGWRGPAGAEAYAAALLAASITLARPEGFIVPLLILLGTLRSPRSRPAWPLVFVATGLAVTAQYGFEAANLGVLIDTFGDEDRTRGALGAAGSGLVGPLIALAPLLLLAIPPRWRMRIPGVAVVVVWLGFLVAARAGALRLDRSLAIARENVFAGAGGWGITLPVLVMLGLLAVGLLLPLLGEPRVAPVGMLVVLYVPLAQLSKNLGDGVGRVHWHDSVNRMWMHVLLAVVLLAILAAGELGRGAPPRGRTGVRIAAPLLALLMLLAGRLWEPVLVADASLERVVAPSPGPAVAAAPELTTGVQVLYDAELQLPDAAALRRADAVELCADVRFGTFARTNTGRVEVRLALDGRTLPTTLDSATFVDNATERVCWPVGSGPEVIPLLGRGVLIGVRGLDASPAPTVVLAADGRPDITMVLRWQEEPTWVSALVRATPMTAAVLLGSALIVWSWSGERLRDPPRRRRRPTALSWSSDRRQVGG